MQEKLKGFTMVELSLAMAFIGVLSLIIITIILDAVSSYRRGITLNQINTTGMDLIDNIRRAVQASPARSLKEECTALYSGEVGSKCISDGGKSLMMAKRYGEVEVNGESLNNVPIYGVFCTGKYSYIWNTGYLFGEDSKVTEPSISGGIQLTYKTTADGEDKMTGKLLKVSDEDRMVCKTVAGYNANTGVVTDDDIRYNGGEYYTYESLKEEMGSEINISSVVIDEPPEDLLESGTFSNLALYDLTSAIPARAQGVNSAFYAMSFILGTTQGGANINAVGSNCKPPEEAMSEFDYCAINKFNFAAQAIGG